MEARRQALLQNQMKRMERSSGVLEEAELGKRRQQASILKK